MNTDLIIWFDFTNVPHVNFLSPIIRNLQFAQHVYSIRDFAETQGLFKKTVGNEYITVGSHTGKNKFMKVIGSLSRIYALQKKIPYFDIKISVGGDSSSIVAKLRKKFSITFDDNEKAPNWRYSKFSDLAFWPEAIDPHVLYKQGFKDTKLFRYNGFKEDLYLADYHPDPHFLENLPFKNFVVVRPENIQANYADGSSVSIVPQLLELLNKLQLNVLFLPRYKEDVALASDYKNVFIPKNAVSGLDACYYSSAVFTGAGTMAREAACMGIPAFSFYTGKELLTVDQKMIEKDWLYFSRDPEKLVEQFLVAKKREPDLQRSVNVKNQIFSKLDKVLKDIKQ